MTPEGITPSGTTPAVEAGQPQNIKEAAQALEGVFLSMLTDELFKGTEAFKASPVYGDLAVEQLADELGRGGGLGLADVLIEQLGGGEDVDQR